MLQFHIIHTNQLIFFLHRNVPDIDHRLAIVELRKEPTILMSSTPVSFQVNILTPTFFLYFSIFRVSLLKFCIRKITCSSQIFYYTTAIINLDDHYNLFNSHARYANGFPDQAGKAVAIYFTNSVSLCRNFQQFAATL